MIIDSHAHIGALVGYYNYDTKLSTLIKRMDTLGITYAISNDIMGLSFGDYDRCYQYDMEAFEESNGRIYSYYTFNPACGQKCLDMMEKYRDRNIFRGIKIHPAQHRTFGDDPRYEAVFQYASKNRLPILCHTWTISMTNPVQKFSVPSKLKKYALQFPDVKLILAHSGGRYQGMLEAIDVAQSCPNVYCDVAGDIYLDRFVETMVESVGAGRVLYGSDYAMMDHRIMLGVVLGADIPTEAKEKILYKNAAAMFGLDISKGV